MASYYHISAILVLMIITLSLTIDNPMVAHAASSFSAEPALLPVIPGLSNPVMPPRGTMTCHKSPPKPAPIARTQASKPVPTTPPQSSTPAMPPPGTMTRCKSPPKPVQTTPPQASTPAMPPRP